MKKAAIAALMFFGMVIPAEAATWYVRTDGGRYGTSSTTCNGQTDAAFTGFNGPNCAVNSMAEIISHRVNGSGGSSGTTRIAAGDTVIVGDPGGDAGEFCHGYDCGPAWSGCSIVDAKNCFLNQPPPGSSPTNRTKIHGRGWNEAAQTCDTGGRPQFWGNNATRVVLDTAGNTEYKCIEVTDHSACDADGVVDGTVDGFPTKCQGNYDPAIPWGPYGITGIQFYSSNNVFQEVVVHGMGLYGFTTVNNFGNQTFINVKSIANGFDGLSTGPLNDGSGTMKFIDTSSDGHSGTVFAWNGCSERYPLLAGIGSTSNLHHCASDEQRANSPDGVAFGRDGSGPAGNWEFYGGSYSHNVGDGIDTLHGSGGGTVLISRILAEGNAGNAVKIFSSTAYLQNSMIIGNCSFFEGQSFTSTKDNLGNNKSFLHCRALGDTLALVIGPNRNFDIYNNTILSNGNIAVLSAGSGCNAGTDIDFKNNIVYGGRSWYDDTYHQPAGGNKLSTFYFKSGSDGNGGGSCGGADGDLTQDYNLVYNTHQNNAGCSGANSQCGVNPQFEGTIKQGGGSVASYYHDIDYVDQLTLPGGSPAVGAGTNSLTYIDGSDDYNFFGRTATFDLGAVEQGSTAGEPVCDQTCSVCADQTTCEASATTCYWWSNSTCNAVPEPACSNDCSICADQTTCEGSAATCYWWSDSQCRDMPEPPDCDDDCTLCANQTTCTNSLQTCTWSGEEVFENFTTYTEVDPSSKIAVSNFNLTVTNLEVGSASYVRKDFGDGSILNLTHEVDATVNARTDTVFQGVWAINNGFTTIANMNAGQNGVVLSYGSNGGAVGWYLEYFGAAYDFDSYTDSGALPLSRYFTITRVGSTITAQIYSDSARTTLLDTLTITADNLAYRYVYAFINRGTAGTQTASIAVSNLDVTQADQCLAGAGQQTCADDCTLCSTQQGCLNTGPSCYWWSDNSCNATEEPATPGTKEWFDGTLLNGVL